MIVPLMCFCFISGILVTTYNPESLFSMRALSFLEAAGVPVMRSFSNCTKEFRKILGLVSCRSPKIDKLFSAWQDSIKGSVHYDPTWKNLLEIIRQLHKDDLAQQVETYLSGTTEENQPEMGQRETVMATKEGKKWMSFSESVQLLLLGGGEVEAQQLLQDEAIYRLKEEMASLRKENESAIFALEERIEELKSENEQLRNQLTPKEEGAMDIMCMSV